MTYGEMNTTSANRYEPADTVRIPMADLVNPHPA
jgi:hypothetical protein